MTLVNQLDMKYIYMFLSNIKTTGQKVRVTRRVQRELHDT